MFREVFALLNGGTFRGGLAVSVACAAVGRSSCAEVRSRVLWALSTRHYYLWHPQEQCQRQAPTDDFNASVTEQSYSSEVKLVSQEKVYFRPITV